MEVTWLLRPDAVWHDGTPLSAEDVVLGFRAGIDPDLFGRGTRVLSQISEVTAPAPQTVLMRWKAVYVLANEMVLDTIVPLPRHLLGPVYDAGDKQAFASSPYLSDEWVGLGPYRLREWQRASHIDVVAFDRYYLGKPKIDRITVRYIGDTNTLLVSIIGGQVDVAPVGNFAESEAHVLKTQWESAGAGSVIVSPLALVIGGWQLRDPSAPWSQDPRIRAAVVKLIDRQILVDSIMNGLSGVDDVFVSKDDPVYPMIRQRGGTASFNYDPAEAHRALAAAGWNRDASGMYRSPEGQPFPIELVAQSDVGTRVQLVLAVTNQWKSAGLDATSSFISGATDWREPAAKANGAYVRRQLFGHGALPAFTTSEIAADSNRWRNSNRGGFSNAAYDQLYTRFWTTLGSTERNEVAADMLKILLDQAAYIPFIYNAEVSATRKDVRGITGVSPAQQVTAWNVHLWTRD